MMKLIVKDNIHYLRCSNDREGGSDCDLKEQLGMRDDMRGREKRRGGIFCCYEGVLQWDSIRGGGSCVVGI